MAMRSARSCGILVGWSGFSLRIQPGSAVKRARRTVIASVTLGMLALIQSGCGWFGAGRQQGAAAGPATLRVMTYNIQSGHGNLEATAAAIRASSPDVVALQEVDVHWAERSAFADQAALLARRLRMHVRFAPIYRIPAPGKPIREFGVALLTRFSIVSWSNDTLTRLSTQDPNPVPAPAPGLLDAVLSVHGTRVHVLNTHLDYRAPSARAPAAGFGDAPQTWPRRRTGDRVRRSQRVAERPRDRAAARAAA